MACKAADFTLSSNRGMAWRDRISAIIRPLSVILLLALFATGIAGAAETPRDAGYFVERAVSVNPTVHEVGERIRIGKGIDPDRMAEFSGMHESISFPGDTDPSEDDFRDEAYGELRAEIRMTYAELASTRVQIDELRRSLRLVRQLAELSGTQYAAGRLEQPQALKAQMEWERLSATLQVLEKREKVISIRLNVLTGDDPEGTIPGLAQLAEYTPDFDSRELTESYKSRRMFVVFQQVIRPASASTLGDELRMLDSVDAESVAFIAVVRTSLESLLLQAKRYRTGLIPRAEQVYTARMESYRTGRTGFGSLLESLVELAELRREYQSMLGEMHVLKARLELTTGRDLEQTASSTNSWAGNVSYGIPGSHGEEESRVGDGETGNNR